jgi:hypothetical protein
MHVPAVQTFAFVGMQTVVQPPQCAMSVCVLVHSPPQHSSPAPHTSPQPPQFISSLCTSMHAPSQTISPAPAHLHMPS